jgi:hypothetical protein
MPQSSIGTSILSLESTYFISNFFPSLGMFIKLDLMLLLNMIESPINLLSGTHLGGRKSYVEFKQESLPQLSLAIELCSLVLYVDFQIASLLILNLMTTFACYPSFAQWLFLQLKLCHLRFDLGGVISNGVMSSN